MPGDVYPKFRAAAVQAAPVFLDCDATIDKLDTLVQKAGMRRKPRMRLPISVPILSPLYAKEHAGAVVSQGARANRAVPSESPEIYPRAVVR
jgi:hypothetical protein